MGQWCSVELRAKVQELESEVEQLSGNSFINSKHVEKFTEHYNLLDELEGAFDSYNPHRSREHVSLWEGIVSPQKFGAEKTDSPDEPRPEKQSQSELLRNNLTCPSSQPQESLPSEAPDILQKETNKALGELSDEYTVYKEKINEYQNSYNKYKNGLSTLKAHLKASSKQLVRWREQSNEYQAIYQESKQVLEDYEKLKNDPQEFNKQLYDIETNVASKRKELHAVEQEILALTKEQEELHDKIQKDTRELGEQDSPNQQRLQEVENRLLLLPAELSALRKQLQEASITPTDRLNAEDSKYRLAFNEIKTIGENVDQKLTKYSLNTTPEAQGSGTASLPEVTGQINNLLSEVKSIQALANDHSGYQHELQLIHEQVKMLVQDIEQIDQEATAFKEQLEEHINHLKAEVLKHSQFKKLSLEADFWRHIGTDIYNPCYSMDRARFSPVAGNDLRSYLLGPCGLAATRRSLSLLLGRGILMDATYPKVAQLVNYYSFASKDITMPWNIPSAFRHYGFDYIYTNTNVDTSKLLTIEKIQHITQQGHSIVVEVEKPGITWHYLLIENATRVGGGYKVTFYNSAGGGLVTLPYKELEKILTGRYILPSEEQVKTKEPILKAQVKLQMKELWNILASSEKEGI